MRKFHHKTDICKPSVWLATFLCLPVNYKSIEYPMICQFCLFYSTLLSENYFIANCMHPYTYLCLPARPPVCPPVCPHAQLASSKDDFHVHPLWSISYWFKHCNIHKDYCIHHILVPTPHLPEPWCYNIWKILREKNLKTN